MLCLLVTFFALQTVAIFLVPDWGDKDDYGIVLSYQTASLCYLAGRYDNPTTYFFRLYPPSQGLRMCLRTMKFFQTEDQRQDTNWRTSIEITP
jgi:hypothetical protein